MSIWYKKINSNDLDTINSMCQKTIIDQLGIQLTDIGDDYLIGIMPVNHQTIQPHGLLHGGASCVLSETLGSIATQLCIDTSKKRGVGINITANHIKAVKSGTVTGKTKAVHIGKSTHLWETMIYNDANEVICISLLTMSILDN